MKHPIAMAIAVVFFAAFMGFYFWLPSDGSEHATAHDSASTPAIDDDGLIAINGKPLIMPGHLVVAAFGCESRDSFDRITQQLKQNAHADASTLLNDAVDSGECALFQKGEHVDVAATKSGFAKIRRKGESQDYWTLGEVVSL